MFNYYKQVKILYQSKDYPIHECLINSNWQEMGQARILISRKTPNDHLVFGVYLVDIYCLGLKDTFYDFNVHQLTYESDLKTQVYFDEPAVECDFNLAHSIIYNSIHYAKNLGFSPQKGFKLSQYILEPEREMELKQDIEFGHEGKPLYISGPHDDREQIIKTLEKTVGDGNFFVMHQEDGDILSNIDEIIEAGYLKPKKVGRNEPCPCGSGKKYKKCCSGKNLNAERAKAEKDHWSEVQKNEKLTLNQLASRKVIDWMTNKHENIIHNALHHLLGYHDIKKAIELFNEDFLTQLANEYAMLDYEDKFLDQTLLSLFLEKKKPLLEQEEIETFLAKLNSYKTLYEVQKVKQGKGLWLKDYFSGEKFFVHEISGTETIKKWDILFARIENLNNKNNQTITGCILSFPREGDCYLNDLKNQYKEALKLFQPGSEEWLFNFRHTMTPMIVQNLIEYHLTMGELKLVNKENNDLIFCSFSAPVSDYKQLENFFRSHKLLQFVHHDRREKVFHWLDKNDSIIGEFRLKRKFITIEANSHERLEIIKKKFLKNIKDWVGEWNLEEKLANGQKSTSAQGREMQFDTHFIEADSEEKIDEIIAQKTKDYYQYWLDMPIPALDGMTPREASQRNSMKEKLIDLLKLIENHHEHNKDIPGMDIKKIKKKLDIEF